MKTKAFCVSLLGSLLLQVSASAQNYNIDWHKIAGGGGASAGGVYSLAGTISQPDAIGAMTGGSYAVTGGFWSLVSSYAVQTPGAPFLRITQAGNRVIVSWDPTVTGFTLQTNASLAAPAWGNYVGPVGNNSTTNSPPKGNVFFRLIHP